METTEGGKISAIDDIHESMYWERVGQGMMIAVKLFRAQERLERVAAHERWEKYWRTRFAKMLRRIANRLVLPEPNKS